uniref:NADH dehydrogenase subunit 6 n=1 Tax=Mesechinus dauuricus TaxID=111452 RepID=UPI0027A29564|nr:NADH dehydrogenase subunit 6 [Mesechinus dauuricus]WIF29444.1 NADH dehydrogenase subunit 6 [Mesechinus dauuricus]WLR81382.1 NADH dehydrogenase subunit 6 [Mesechinus dauuricus]
MMIYLVLLFSLIFVVGFIGFSSKPSPIYGGVGLIVSGGFGCGLVLSCEGSFLGLLVFLIYLGGMLVVFGYTAAMAMEEYPEVWSSNKVLLSSLLLGCVSELLFMGYLIMGREFSLSFALDFDSEGDWVIFDTGDTGFFSEEAMGVTALYSYGTWLVVVSGWSLVFCVIIIMEITRGN